MGCREAVEKSLRTRGGRLLLEAWVRPGSRRVGIEVDGDRLVFNVASPPRGGRANRELLELVRRATGARPRLVAGMASGRKVLDLGDAGEREGVVEGLCRELGCC